MKCDLHIHSHYSSGNQSLEEILQEVSAKGIKLISITDDDTTEAYKELPALAEKYTVSYIKGIQVGAAMKGHLFRFMAYDYDLEIAALQTLLAANRAVWDTLSRDILTVFSKYHKGLSVEEYDGYAKNPGHGGFKYNSYLYSKGFDGGYEAVNEMIMQYKDEIFALLGKLDFTPVNEVIKIIHDSGGKAILPGGYLRSAETLDADLEALVSMGIDGFECFSTNYQDDIAQTVKEYAVTHNLLITGGGDGHGSWTTTYNIGVPEVDTDDLNLGGITVYP